MQPARGAGDGDHIRRFGGRPITIEEATANGSLPPASVEAAPAVLGPEGNVAQSSAFHHSRGSLAEHIPHAHQQALKEPGEGVTVEPGSGLGSQRRQLPSRSPPRVGAGPARAWLPSRRAEGGAYEAERRWANGRR